jgi:hypothetical protein
MTGALRVTRPGGLEAGLAGVDEVVGCEMCPCLLLAGAVPRRVDPGTEAR